MSKLTSITIDEKDDEVVQPNLALKLDKKQSIFVEGKSIIEVLRRKDFSSVLLYFSNNKKICDYKDILIHLNENFSKVDHIPGLKTSLYQHQQTAVMAMLELEMIRDFKSKNFNIKYNAAVLSEPVGSGKTIDILSLICLNKIPPNMPQIIDLKTKPNQKHIGFVKCHYKNILKPTLIFVGTSVMKQWENAIKTFTNFKFFSINSVIELKKLLVMISDQTINNYDIILAKNGKITVPITLPDGIKLDKHNKVSTPYIYNIISNLYTYCWARVVIDDFDTIRLPSTANIIHGLFTWYISSTRKSMATKKHDNYIYDSTIEDLSRRPYCCGDIMNDHTLFMGLNVRNNTQFIKSVTNIPSLKFHVIKVTNTNDGILNLLNSMEDSKVNQIIESINADDIESAAQLADIKAVKVVDLFQKILGDKFESYRFAGDILSFIDFQEGKEDERKAYANYADHLKIQIENLNNQLEKPIDIANIDMKILDEKDLEGDDLIICEMAKLKQQLTYTKKRLLKFEDIEYKYPGVNQLLESTKIEYDEVKKVNGLAIERIKNNIQHGQCPICKQGLGKGDKVIIVKCCSTMFCDTCGIAAQKLDKRYNMLKGKCSNCTAAISINNLIYLGSNFEFSNITNEIFEDEEITKVETVEEKKRPTTKYTLITDIIKGNVKSEDHIRVDMAIPNMMKGAGYTKEPKIRKVLIFANYEKTIDHVLKELKESNIKHWRLQGGLNEINDTSLAFTNYKEQCALVINSSKHCSGLNLQTATDLVFAHYIIDSALESQVAGRGHRLGRTTPLNIWYVIYKNEYNTLQQSHDIREMTEEELLKEEEYSTGNAEITMSNVVEAAKVKKTGKSKQADKTKKIAKKPKEIGMSEDIDELDEEALDEEALDEDILDEKDNMDDDDDNGLTAPPAARNK